MDWATWDYREEFGPVRIHSGENVTDMVDFIASESYLDNKGKLSGDIGVVEKYLLASALFYWDIKASQFNAEGTVPHYIYSTSHAFSPTDGAIITLWGRMAEVIPLAPDLEPDLDMIRRQAELFPITCPTAESSGGGPSNFAEFIPTSAEPLILPPGPTTNFTFPTLERNEPESGIHPPLSHRPSPAPPLLSPGHGPEVSPSPNPSRRPPTEPQTTGGKSTENPPTEGQPGGTVASAKGSKRVSTESETSDKARPAKVRLSL